MEIIDHEPAPAGLGLNDLLFMVFRHKRKIILCTLAGLAAAAAAYFFIGRDFESSAKLLVRYVLERSAIDPVEQQTKPMIQSETMINTEIEILTSVDLAVQVVDALGVERFLPKAKAEASRARAASPAPLSASPAPSSEPSGSPATAADQAAAVRSILTGMTVEARKGSNVISVSYKNPDPDLARDVMVAVVKEYQHEHLDVHRSLGAFDFVKAQATKLGNTLAETEKALKSKKDQLHILSLSDSTANLQLQRTRLDDALLAAESESAEQQARLKELGVITGGAPAQPGAADGVAPAGELEQKPGDNVGKAPESEAQVKQTANPPPALPHGEMERYQFLGDQVVELRKLESELRKKFTPGNQSVKTVRQQIADLDRERRALEQQYPALLAVAPKPASTANSTQPDIATERADLAAVMAKIQALQTQRAAVEVRAVEIANATPDILRLERKKELEEGNLKYIESSLERAATDEALGKDGKTASDISVVQNPTNSVKVTGKTAKIVLALAGGGFGLGLGLALFIELILNRSLRRPLELETRLRIPQILSIPYFPAGAPRQLQLESESATASGRTVARPVRLELVPWDMGHFIRPYAEAIRDRLILAFKLRNLTHKPKLVGVAGLSGGEGASTLAASLAAALSEAGDGKVLLVDLYAGNEKAHPFVDGRPVFGLVEALEANGNLPPVADNLYVASGVSSSGGSAQLPAKRFYALIPSLRASHFDYIIFDLPPVNQGSATLAIAGCLDKLLFVVEAEKSDRDEVKRAYEELIAAKADVSGVLNKIRSSGPKWLNA